MVPFAGIAFLWFLGALRDRLGPQEDRFFASFFFGSGLLFLAMFFTAAAIIGALLLAFASRSGQPISTDTFHFARAVAFNIMNVYAVKMAGVFMFSTSTVVIYTKIAPLWIAILGYALALVLLLRELFDRLGLCRFAGVGFSNQRLYFFRQLPPDRSDPSGQHQ